MNLRTIGRGLVALVRKREPACSEPGVIANDNAPVITREPGVIAYDNAPVITHDIEVKVFRLLARGDQRGAEAILIGAFDEEIGRDTERRRRLRAVLAALALVLCPALALAQGVPLFQSGIVTPNHVMKSSGNGLQMDAGGLTGDNNGRGLSPFAITDNLGLGLCSHSAVTGGAHYEFCLGHDSSGNALLSVTANGGALERSMYLSKNGTLYEVPFVGAGSGNVVGPSPAVVDHVPLLNATNGTLLKDSGYPLSEVGRLDPTLRYSAQLHPTPGNLYVSKTGSDAADCLSATVSGGHGPCLTIDAALSLALGRDGRQANININIGAGTWNELVAVNGWSVGTVNRTSFVQNVLSAPMIRFIGAGSSSTFIDAPSSVGGQGFCYTVLANNGAMIGLESLTVRATASPAGCMQSALFVQTNAIIFIDRDVRLGPASGHLIAAEEAGGIYVDAGCGGCTGLTLVGGTTGGNGIHLDEKSWFTSDSTVNILGALTFNGGHLFRVEYGSVIKLSGNPGVTSGATVTGARFLVGSLSVLVVAHPPAVWPGSIGGVYYGGRYQASDNGSCIGGVVGCPAVFLPTNLGGSGTTTMAPYSGMYGGSVQLLPLTGAGPAPSVEGLIFIGWRTAYQIEAFCTPVLINGSGSWPDGATVLTSGYQNDNGIFFHWKSATAALTSGLTYYIAYTCSSGK